MRALLLTLSAALVLACSESATDPARADAGLGDALARAADARTPDAGDADALTPGADVTATDAGPSPPDGGAGPSGPYFEQGGFFTDDVSAAPVSPDSAATIAALRRGGGWGNRDTFQIDFSLEVLHDDGTAPLRAFTPTGDFYEPDCDLAEVPVPVGGNLEGEGGYACTTDGDCHLIVYSPTRRRLFEMWRANLDSASFEGGCLAIWDTSRRYGPEGRGLQCTSADAAGFPIAPLMFDADEVAAGEIRHAVRFVLPNDRVRRGFVPPATHGTNTTGGEGAPYYGVHLRLRADYPLDRLPNDGARTVARALQRYGMYHADGGQIALTARSDRRTRAKWDGLLGPRDLSALRVEDFEVIDHGPTVPLTYDCVR